MRENGGRIGRDLGMNGKCGDNGLGEWGTEEAETTESGGGCGGGGSGGVKPGIP
jgi:hypothetical protein